MQDSESKYLELETRIRKIEGDGARRMENLKPLPAPDYTKEELCFLSSQLGQISSRMEALEKSMDRKEQLEGLETKARENRSLISARDLNYILLLVMLGFVWYHMRALGSI